MLFRQRDDVTADTGLGRPRRLDPISFHGASRDVDDEGLGVGVPTERAQECDPVGDPRVGRRDERDARASREAGHAHPAWIDLRQGGDELAAAGEVDAIYFQGAVLDPIKCLERIESELKANVVASNPAMFWYVLSKLGQKFPMTGYGRLLREWPALPSQ